jgi:CRP-like cAMP-binding protein
MSREMSVDFSKDISDWLVKRRVADAVKDTEILRTSLRELTFFEEFIDEDVEELIEAMEVFEFGDKEKVVRQGDTDGTHFFVVAEGEFVVLKDSEPIAVLGPGKCFGESVLMLFGERRASVVSNGTSRAYGMEGMAVREMLRAKYEEKRVAVVEAIDEVLMSDGCEMLSTLNAYQLQSLYDQVEMRQYDAGTVILHEGPCGEKDELLVVCDGVVKSTKGGEDMGTIPRFAVVGDRQMVFKEAPSTLTAESRVRTLVLSRGLLETIFGDQLEQVLVRNRILSVLSQHKVFSRLHEEQREAVASSCVIREIQPGEELTGAQICEGGSVAEQIGLPNFEADYWLSKDDMRLAVEMLQEPSKRDAAVLDLKCAQDLLNLFSLYHSTHSHASTPSELKQEWEKTKYRRDSDHERFYKVIKRMLEHCIPKEVIPSIPDIRRSEMDEVMKDIFQEWVSICIARVEQEMHDEVFTILTEAMPAGAEELPVWSMSGFWIGHQVEISSGETSEIRPLEAFGTDSLILDIPLINAYPAGAKVVSLKKTSGHVRQSSKVRAIENFENFYGLVPGSVSVDQVAKSTCGISGWCSNNRDHMKTT